jgi:hypothetical protein
MSSQQSTQSVTVVALLSLTHSQILAVAQTLQSRELFTD